MLLAILMCLSSCFLSTIRLKAQEKGKIKEIRGALKDAAEYGSSVRWLKIREQASLDTAAFWSQHKNNMDIGGHSDMIERKRYTDNMGISHIKYQQMYKGIPVQGGEYILHSTKGKVKVANGHLYHVSDINVRPSKNYRELVQRLVKQLDSLGVHSIMDSSDALSIIPFMAADSSYSFSLCYSVSFLRQSNHIATEFLLDAHTGEIIRTSSLNNHACDAGTVSTFFNGNQTIKTTYRTSTNDYELFNQCSGSGNVPVYGHSPLTLEPNYYTDADNIWNSGDTRKAANGVWIVMKALEYFYNIHGRNSADNNGSAYSIRALDVTPTTFTYGSNYPLFPNLTQIYLGEINGCVPASLDIVGHEFTHGIIRHELGKPQDLSPETKGLMESFCDIFGTMIEYVYDTQNADYEVGGGTCLYARSMANPKQTGLFQSPCPDTYNGQYWDINSPHHTAGVQNHWFYLLSEGGSGVNDNGNSYYVTGIGRDKAAQITYRSLAYYLTSQSTYVDAYNGSVQSAIDLYGECSQEVEQTVRAWRAVGVEGYYSYYKDITSSIYGTLYFNPPLVIKGVHGIHWYSTGNNVSSFNDDGKVVFEAGGEIRLSRNVFVGNGNVFHARINKCNYSTHNPKTSNNPIDYSSSSYWQPSTIEHILVYPNPATDEIRIIGSVIGEVQVYSSIGMELLTIKQGTKNINVSMLPNGSYYARIPTPNGIVIKPFVIVR